MQMYRVVPITKRVNCRMPVPTRFYIDLNVR